MTVVIGGSSPEITFADSTVQNTAALPLTGGSLTGNITSTGSISSVNTFGFKNRIINGGMQIDQRNNGASVGTSNLYAADVYTVDRWVAIGSQNSKFTIQQNAGSVTPPTGYTNYLGITSSSAYSVTSSDFFNICQRIEGFNIADLAWGTANAKTVTLSFWVYSSLTGTFGGTLMNNAGTQAYPFTYTISSTNTWTQISITISGSTTGTWLSTNGRGIQIQFGLGVGSTYSGSAGTWSSSTLYSATGAVSVVGTNGATFYITGVQLEVGTQATAFDYRPYGTELVLCQRYFQKSFNTSVAPANNLGSPYVQFVLTGVSGASYPQGIYFAVTMRTAPTITAYNPLSATAGTWHVYQSNNTSADATLVISTTYTTTAMFSGSFSGGSYVLGYGDWTASAEL